MEEPFLNKWINIGRDNSAAAQAQPSQPKANRAPSLHLWDITQPKHKPHTAYYTP